MLFPDYHFCSSDWAGPEKVSPYLSYNGKVSPERVRNRSHKKNHIASSPVPVVQTPLAPGMVTLRNPQDSKYVLKPLENSPLLGCWDHSEVD